MNLIIFCKWKFCKFNLANSIETQNGRVGWNGESKVLPSMFTNEVSAEDIRSVVTKYKKNKTSADSDGIDIIMVKNNNRNHNHV